VFAVAISELAGTAEGEAAPLAADLGCTAYDARLLLAPGLPAVVRTTPDRAAALDLLARLRARGHGAVACDLAAVVASSAMSSMRRFRLDGDAIALDDAPGERLPYDDVLALIAAVHRRRTDTDTTTRERRLSVGRALMTSGLSMTKTVTTGARTTTDEREAVLYVFRRGGAPPWILHERGTVWGGHGRPLAPSEAQNFRIAIDELRARTPGAAYDDRLVTRRAPERAALAGGPASTSVTTSSDAGIDLLAHLVALGIARAGAYR
jgi:hypothetical protein